MDRMIDELFTEELILHMIDVLKTNEVAMKTFKHNLYDRVKPNDIRNVARNWISNAPSMQRSLAITTMGLFYSEWYIALMNYLSANMEK